MLAGHTGLVYSVISDGMQTYFPAHPVPKKQGSMISFRGENVIFTRITGFDHSIDSSGRRDVVDGFSNSSARRMRRYLTSCVADYKFIGTLTYGDYDAARWEDTKSHLKKFLQSFRERASRDYSCFWFMEFQQRGAPHYHFFSTELFPIDHRRTKGGGSAMDCARSALAQAWAGATGDKSQKHINAGTQLDAIRSGRNGTVAYAIKYAAKQSQKIVPDMFRDKETGKSTLGRWWGISGEKKVMEAAIRVIHGEPERREQKIFRKRLLLVLEEAVKTGKASCYRNEWCRIYKIDKEQVDEWIDVINYKILDGVEVRIRPKNANRLHQPT